MWFFFRRSRDRFSLQELRYLRDQLQKVQIVNDVNKGYVIEALRSIAELVTYGDQHDPTFFEFFTEKQIMGEFVRILNVSGTVSVTLQLLQTMSIMIENLKSECAIDYILSSELVNYLITYSFDFKNEEILSYYIAFLRAISGKLNKHTISLLMKTQNDGVVSFPLYVEAVRFAFHEENMVRIAVRALTLNVYHVGDECVNRFVTSTPVVGYFSNLVTYFRKQCMDLDGWVSKLAKNPDLSDTISCILAAVDEIEETLYYFSDVISSEVPSLGKSITDNILELLVFPLLLPSLMRKCSDGVQISASTSFFLLCCILRIVKTKDLASSIGASLLCLPESFSMLELSPNDYTSGHGLLHENSQTAGCLSNIGLNASSSQIHPAGDSFTQHGYDGQHLALRDVLLSYVVSGDDMHVLGSLSFLASLLQAKEVDKTMLDALGILPQRKQHKKLLLQALTGEASGKEPLSSKENDLLKDGRGSELEDYLQKLKDVYGLFSSSEPGISPQMYRYQVLHALVSLLCRSDVSAETLWDGGWLLCQLLPCNEGVDNNHLKHLRDSRICTDGLLREIRGSWCDLLIAVLTHEWKKCKKVTEASSPQRDLKCILFPSRALPSEGESTFTAGEEMHEMVKVLVLHHQLRIFCSGGLLPNQPPVCSPLHKPVNFRAKCTGLDAGVLKPGSEISIVDSVACRIAFERGKERQFCFSAISRGMSGWVLLSEELPLKSTRGVVRVAAPLAGSNPQIDNNHSTWLHLRIRPSTLPFTEPAKPETFGRGRTKPAADGRWTLAFKDEKSCKLAESMVLAEMRLQSSEVERKLKPLLNLDSPAPVLNQSCTVPETASLAIAHPL